MLHQFAVTFHIFNTTLHLRLISGLVNFDARKPKDLKSNKSKQKLPRTRHLESPQARIWLLVLDVLAPQIHQVGSATDIVVLMCLTF